VTLSGTPVGLPAIASSGEAGGHENITIAKNENLIFNADFGNMDCVFQGLW
jgi:hypothetical protein